MKNKTSLGILAFVGKFISKKLEKMTKDPMKAQDAYLFDILNRCKDTEIGKKYDFASIKTIEEFQKRMPLTTYDDYAEAITRMVNGEKNILTNLDINHYNKTSGTVGVPKKIPCSEPHISLFGKYNALYFTALQKKEFGTDWMKGKGLSLMEGTIETLPSNATFGSASALSTARCSSGKGSMIGNLYSSPMEAKMPEKGLNTRYIHARFGLMSKDITYGSTTFSSFMAEFMHYIELNWEMLVNDIEAGTIDPSVNMSDECRKSLLKKITPMPERAKELREAFSLGFDTPIVPRIWPNFRYFVCAGGANFQSYTDKLKNKYFGPNIDFLFLGLSASEAYISTPFKKNCLDSVLVPDGVFMEFRPLEEENTFLTLDKLEVGKNYEVILTNMDGLYRYRIKDAVTVTGKYNNTPTVQFLYRVDDTVSIMGEKTTGFAINKCIVDSMKECNLDMFDYSLYPNVDDSPVHYTFLVELNPVPTSDVLEKLQKTIEKNLAICNPSMGAKVNDGICGKTEVFVLQPETYLLYRDIMVMKGANAVQLKPVHIIRNPFQKKYFFGLREKIE